MPRTALRVPYNDIRACVQCGVRIDLNNSSLISHKEIFDAYYSHNVLIPVNYRICSDCCDNELQYDQIPTQSMSRSDKLSTYHRTLQNIKSHTKSVIQSLNKRIKFLENESTFHRIKRQKPNKIKS